MENIWEYRDLIFIKGGLLTIQVGLGSLVIATIFGLLGAWAKLTTNFLLNWLAMGYTTIIRGIPDLVLMLIIFFEGQIFLNFAGEWTGLWTYVEISPLTAGIGTIGFIMGAYYTETFRGAFLSIPNGQIEAGIACGMSRPLIFRRIDMIPPNSRASDTRQIVLIRPSSRKL
jgi:histidine transport system permease protein/arginine/ornithine transport system permease protein